MPYLSIVSHSVPIASVDCWPATPVHVVISPFPRTTHLDNQKRRKTNSHPSMQKYHECKTSVCKYLRVYKYTAESYDLRRTSWNFLLSLRLWLGFHWNKRRPNSATRHDQYFFSLIFILIIIIILFKVWFLLSYERLWCLHIYIFMNICIWKWDSVQNIYLCESCWLLQKCHSLTYVKHIHQCHGVWRWRLRSTNRTSIRSTAWSCVEWRQTSKCLIEPNQRARLYIAS